MAKKRSHKSFPVFAPGTESDGQGLLTKKGWKSWLTRDERRYHPEKLAKKIRKAKPKKYGLL